MLSIELSWRQEEWAARQCGRSEGSSCTSQDREEGGRDDRTLHTAERKWTCPMFTGAYCG